MTPTDGDVVVRLGTPEDVEAVADLYTAARVHAVPQMPPALHTNAEDRAHFAQQMAKPEVEFWLDCEAIAGR